MNTKDPLEQYYCDMSCISLHGEKGNEPAQLHEPGDIVKVLVISTSVVAAIFLATSFIPVSSKSSKDNSKKEIPALKTNN